MPKYSLKLKKKPSIMPYIQIIPIIYIYPYIHTLCIHYQKRNHLIRYHFSDFLDNVHNNHDFIWYNYRESWPFDEFNGFESFIHVANGQIVAEVQHCILGAFVAFLQPHKVPHRPASYHPWGGALRAGPVSLIILVARILWLLIEQNSCFNF